ncbi:MAG: flavin-dependent oxidoreductase [Proteobacteria bacterium]|jgi:2-polyprenyl-6-methoxyphenol hydroxylase-like FAD-dependent oxidoreductase|nr:flavin-dependent oxidoreductase [Pseudomonadota bacterium]
MIIISGAGIAGLSLGLTCHQLGIPFQIFEKAQQLEPLGVGINIQPTAVRELEAMGLLKELETIGVKTRELAFFTKRGLEIWSEPRGLEAGYNYPQFSVHRGKLQMLLYRALIKRCGRDIVKLGCKITETKTKGNKISISVIDQTNKLSKVEANLCIAADGINSTLREQMYPDEGSPRWEGVILWRGTSKSKPFRTGATMAMIGHATQRIVAYPISPPDRTGNVIINWICERKLENTNSTHENDWNKSVEYNKFLPYFKNWSYDWFDFPKMVQSSSKVLEYPMVDRDPVDNWVNGLTLLIGDAAHPAYPTGSNGGTQAILDARNLGRALIELGATEAAIIKFQERTLEGSNRIVLANRESGPDAILQVVEERCGGTFDTLDTVITRTELSEHSAKFKSLVGLSVEQFNKQPSILGAYL